MLLSSKVLQFHGGKTRYHAIRQVRVDRRQGTTSGLKGRSRQLRVLQDGMLRRITLVGNYHVTCDTVPSGIHVRPLNGFLFGTVRDPATGRRGVLNVSQGRFLIKVLTPALKERVRREAFRRFRRSLLRTFAARVANCKEVVALTHCFICLVGGRSALLYLKRIVVHRLRRAYRGTFGILARVAYLYRGYYVCGDGEGVRRLYSDAHRWHLSHANATCRSSIQFFGLRVVATILLRRAFMVIMRQRERRALNVILAGSVLVRRLLCFCKFEGFFRVRLHNAYLLTDPRDLLDGLVDLNNTAITSVTVRPHCRGSSFVFNTATGATSVFVLS